MFANADQFHSWHVSLDFYLWSHLKQFLIEGMKHKPNCLGGPEGQKYKKIDIGRTCKP